MTCSGGRNTGSLNVVRTAADFHEIAVLNGIPNALNVWPIRPNYDSPYVVHILVRAGLSRTDSNVQYTFTLDGVDFARILVIPI